MVGYALYLAPKQESNEILISMNKGTPKQRQLEAEFVSSNQSKHFERVKCALAISLETDISNDAVAIESFGGCKNVCHILKTEHPGLSYGRFVTNSTLATVLYSKLEDSMSDMLVEMKECVEKHDSVASDAESAAEVVLIQQSIDLYQRVGVLCLRRVIGAILYLLTGFVEEIEQLEAQGWAQTDEHGGKHPLLQQIDDNRDELLSLVHKTQVRMLKEEDAFGLNGDESPLQENETSESLLMAIERPTIKCLNDCSRIISILSENEIAATRYTTTQVETVEMYMQKLGSMKLHSDILGHVIVMRSRVERVVQVQKISCSWNNLPHI